MIGGGVQVQDAATPALAAIARLVRAPRGLMAAAGKRVEKEYRGHFLALDRQGNARGWPRSHFWARRVRQATSLTSVTDTGAKVTIASPEFGHKVRGGTVRPKRGKFLAIPMTPQAKARRKKSLAVLIRDAVLVRSPRIVEVTARSVTVGTDRPYAAYHQLGTRRMKARWTGWGD
jgi:phage gpG-like protein